MGDDMNTTLLSIEYDHGSPPLIPETPADCTLDEALSSIMSGEHFGTLRAVHRISDGKCDDVSEVIADLIIAALRRGDYVSPFAREFANYCSRDMPEAA